MRSFIVLLTKFYMSDQIKEYCMSRGMQHVWGEEKHSVVVWKSEGKKLLRDLGG
jgi:hypothetical protein